jgi:hypothetical protein
MLAMPPLHSPSLQFVAGLYVFAGLAVKGIALFRGLKIRRSHFKGEPVWDSRENGGNSLFMFLAATDWHPVGIVFQNFALADLVGLTGLFQHSAFKNDSRPTIAQGDPAPLTNR